MTATTAELMLLAGVCAFAGACAAYSSSGGGDISGSGGMSGAGGTGACQVNINPVIPTSFAGLVAAPGARLRVEGDPTGAVPPAFTFLWTVTTADGTPVPTTTVGGDPSLIELPIETPGTYTIAVQLVGGGACAGLRTVTVTQGRGRLATFRLRMTPPPGAEPVQEQAIQVVGGTPSGGNVFMLSAGLLYVADVRDASGQQPLAAYLRLTDAAHDIVIEAHRQAAGPPPALHLASGTFDLLVVPDGDVAPLLLTQQEPGDMVAMGALALPPGETISGTVREAASPLAGATVVLRAGARPSTIATTAADGTFTLHAAPGTYAATVTRPIAVAGQTGTQAIAGTLEVTLPGPPGVVVPSRDGVGLDVDLGAASTTTLSLSLGTAVTPGTRVVLQSTPVADQAAFAMGGQSIAAMAEVRSELEPAPDGTLTVTGLPRGHYHGKVVPGAGMQAAITPIADLDLTAESPAPQTIPLLAPVPMTGNFVPGAQAGGIPLSAVDVTGDVVAAVSGTTDTQGGFDIAVSPNRTYSLRVRPGPDRPLASAVFAPLVVGANGLQLANGQMPNALLFAGRVLDSSGVNGSPGTLLQVYCVGAAPACVDPATPVAETVTASDGTFTLQLPDPGVD